MIDGAENPRWLIRAAVETVASLVRQGTPTLVCCGAGMSRAPAVAGAAVALLRECPPEEGLTVVCRPGRADVSPALWDEVHACARLEGPAPGAAFRDRPETLPNAPAA